MKWVKDVLVIAVLLPLAISLWTVAWHIRTWTRGADQLIVKLQTVADTAQDKVKAVDVERVNSSLRNIDATTGRVNTIAADLQGSLPKIHKGAFLLWKHADRTMGHLDEATDKYVDQQQAITDKTAQTLDSTNRVIQHLDKVVTDPNIPLAISHVNGVAANGEATMAHVDHVAAHYDQKLTAPKRWWQKLKDVGTAAGIWFARHL